MGVFKFSPVVNLTLFFLAMCPMMLTLEAAKENKRKRKKLEPHIYRDVLDR